MKGAPGVAHPVTGGKSSSSGARPQTQNNEPSTMVDAEGDIQMSGINQLATLLISALGKAQKEEKKKKARNNKTGPTVNFAGSDKPRAKWTTAEERATLMTEGKCFRCRKRGHMGIHCPDFRPAKSPGSRVNAAGTKTEESSSSGEDPGSCSSDSDANSEKE